MRSALPLAKLRGDHNTYSDIKFTDKGNSVLITATRFSVLKNYHSPISLLVARTTSGNWLIIEELSESRP